MMRLTSNKAHQNAALEALKQRKSQTPRTEALGQALDLQMKRTLETRDQSPRKRLDQVLRMLNKLTSDSSAKSRLQSTTKTAWKVILRIYQIWPNKTLQIR